MGTVRRDGPRTLRYKTSSGGEESSACNLDDVDSIEQEPGRPFRVCDYIAWRFSSVEGSPRCELYWPEDRRDRAVAECAAYLKRFGARFTGEAPDGQRDFPERQAHLAFPALGRPANTEDVRSGRAIFSLEGQGEVRTVPIPSMPTKARWITLKDFPVEFQRSDGTVFSRIRSGWLALAGRGGPQGRSLGTILRIRWPPRGGAGPRRRDRARTARSPQLGLARRAGLDVRDRNARPRTDDGLRTRQADPRGRCGSAIAAGSRTRRRRSSSAAARWPAVVAPRGQPRRLLFRPEPTSVGRRTSCSRGGAETEADGPFRPGQTPPVRSGHSRSSRRCGST